MRPPVKDAGRVTQGRARFYVSPVTFDPGFAIR
jgi:hypothetical protein